MIQVIYRRIVIKDNDGKDELEFLKAAQEALSVEIDDMEKQRDALGAKIDLDHVRSVVGFNSKAIGMKVQEYCESRVGKDDLEAVGKWIDSKLTPSDISEVEYITSLTFKPNPLENTYPDALPIYFEIGQMVLILQKRLNDNPRSRKKRKRRQ